MQDIRMKKKLIVEVRQKSSFTKNFVCIWVWASNVPALKKLTVQGLPWQSSG